MEDVLDLYGEPYDPRRPTVCFDETSTQLIAERAWPYVATLVLLVAALPWITLAPAARGSQAAASAAPRTITVTTTADTTSCGTPCSLRGAIGTADSGDTINFAVTGDIILTGGQLNIAKNLAIEGPGSGDLVISGNNDSWVFNIAGGNVAISGMTIQYGGIDNFGTLTLTNTTISGTTPNRVQGGGIFNRGTLTLTNSTVSGNWRASPAAASKTMAP